MGNPKNRWFIRENPINGWFGGNPILGNLWIDMRIEHFNFNWWLYPLYRCDTIVAGTTRSISLWDTLSDWQALSLVGEPHSNLSESQFWPVLSPCPLWGCHKTWNPTIQAFIIHLWLYLSLCLEYRNGGPKCMLNACWKWMCMFFECGECMFFLWLKKWMLRMDVFFCG